MDSKPAWQAYTPVWFIVLVVLLAVLVGPWLMQRAEDDCRDRGGHLVDDYSGQNGAGGATWSCVGPDGAAI